MLSPRRLFYLILSAPILAVPASVAAPGDFSDNRSLKIIQTTPANFPDHLAVQGIREGEVRAVLSINADGKLADCLVIAYTHPDFAREVLSSVRSWEFEPPYERGQPVHTRAEVTFSFHARGMVLSLSPADTVAMQWNGILNPRMVSYVAKSTELDRPLTVIDAVSPRHPGNLISPARPTGTVTLDFYIDAEGRPRMPVVRRASHELFAHAALEALSQWKFAPPTRGGQPAVVRVTQEFNFKEGT
jgi:TonB family protein